MTSAKGPVIGIDLGTTSSCVGFFHNGKITIIENDFGNRTTPSFVAFTDENDVFGLVGDSARNQMGKNPTNTIFGNFFNYLKPSANIFSP